MGILPVGLSCRLFGVRFLDFLLFFFSLALVTMSVEGNDSNPEGFGSELAVDDLGMAQGFCFIPAKFGVELARPKERVHQPPLGRLGIYEEALKAGLRFSLHPFIIKLIKDLTLNPSQTVPNSW